MTTKLLVYLPPFYNGVLEMEQLLASEDAEFNEAAGFNVWLVDQSTITRADENRISEWEKLLQIAPMGTLEQRRMMVIATLRGKGKLNEAKIKQIVESFTGDTDAEVTFANSTLRVRILPPDNGEIFLFPDVERTLLPLIPAHIRLKVERWYCTWGDIKSNKTDWQAVYDDFTTWNDVKMWNLEV
jgi:hypothetical protein